MTTSKMSIFFKKVSLFIKKITLPITNSPLYFIALNFLLLLPTYLQIGIPSKRYFILNFGIVYLFLAFVEIIKAIGLTNKEKKLVRVICFTLKVIFATLICVIVVTNVFLIYHFDTIINTYILQLLSETNVGESEEFVSTYLISIKTLKSFLVVIASILVALLIYGIIKICLPKFSSRLKTFFLMILSLMCVATSFKTICLMQFFGPDYYQNYKHSCLTKHPLFSLVNSAWQFSSEKKSVKELLHQCNYVQNVTCDEGCDNIVLIIGESFCKHHSGLYGYTVGEQQTNPYLSELSNLAIFSDVISSTNSTIHAFRSIFSCSSNDDDKEWFESPLFTYIFRKAGFTVSFWSNQFILDLSQNTFSISFFNNKDISDSNFNERNKQQFQYDYGLVDDYFSTHSMEEKKHLAIFHLMGSHLARVERFPDDYRQFTKEDYSKRCLSDIQKQEIADYDNSILYNDYVVNEIINKYKEEDAIIIYFSDHGDESYDFRDHVGRAFDFTEHDGKVLKYQVEIPFIIYMTQKYREMHKEIAEAVFNNTNTPFMTDDVPHLLFDIAGIDCENFIPSKSPLNEAYDKNKHRFIISPYTRELIDYDEYKCK